MKKIFIILICLLIASPAFAKSPLDKLLKYFKNGEVIKIQSYTAKNFIEIKDGTYKKSPIEIDAFISYPKKGDGPFPVLVFVHSSGGPLLFTDEWFKFNRQVAKSLQKKGIAVMFLDNFVPRGTYTTYANQQKVTHWSTYIDAFKALEYLSKQPKVNIKKIGITGWSRGGMISLMVSEKRLRDILVSKDLYFAAAQPRSPDCTTNMFRNPQPIKETKTWMVLGEADDYTLAEDCVEQGKRIKAKGGDIEITVKKGWGHGFTANYEAEYEADPMIFHNCPDSLMEDDGTYGTSDPNYYARPAWCSQTNQGGRGNAPTIKPPAPLLGDNEMSPFQR